MCKSKNPYTDYADLTKNLIFANKKIIMQKQKFNDVVKKHFKYLIDDYGFCIKEETLATDNPLWQGIVVYANESESDLPFKKKPFVRLVLDRGYVMLDIKSEEMTEREWFDISEVMKLIAPEVQVHEKVDYSKDPYEIVETQIQNLSKLLVQYCDSLLKGDFSIGDQIQAKRMQEREDRIVKWKKQKEEKLFQDMKSR
jgi:hypothetical protein